MSLYSATMKNGATVTFESSGADFDGASMQWIEDDDKTAPGLVYINPREVVALVRVK